MGRTPDLKHVPGRAAQTNLGGNQYTVVRPNAHCRCLFRISTYCSVDKGIAYEGIEILDARHSGVPGRLVSVYALISIGFSAKRYVPVTVVLVFLISDVYVSSRAGSHRWIKALPQLEHAFITSDSPPLTELVQRAGNNTTEVDKRSIHVKGSNARLL